MQREKARLEALRSMPYEEYVQTLEWQEVQKAALKRAGNRCQVCRANNDNVILNTYHTAYENLGCEQEGDVMVLCEACYDRLYQQIAGREDTPGEAAESSYPKFSFGKKVGVFAPTALVTMGLPAILHAPLPAEIFGLVAAIALAVNSPKIYGEMRESLPTPFVALVDGMAERKRARAATGEWSKWDLLLGRHLREDAPDQSEASGSADSLDPTDDQQDYLNLGPTLKPHADTALSGRKVMLGTSGSGKTNNMNVYCEELGKLKPAPALILFDTDDENRALCNRAYLPNPMWLDKSRRLTVGNAFQAAQTIMEERYQCIINLQSFEDEEAAWIMINMIKGVRAWQEAREVRIPCELVLDEASVWLPQNTRESVLSSILVDDPDTLIDEDEEADQAQEGEKAAGKKISLLSLLQRAFFSTVVRRGRRRGMGFTLAAQRIAEIDKRALQGSWMFLMRQTQPADWREYQKFGITSEEALGLIDGEAFVFAPGKPREKHRFRESNSPHGGITPGMKALRGSTKMQRGAAQSSTQEPEARGLPTAETKKQDERSEPSRETTINAVLQLRDKVDEQTFLALLDALPVIKTEEGAEVGATRKLPENQAADGTTIDRSRRHEVPRYPKGTASLRHPAASLPAILQEVLDVFVPGMTYRDLGTQFGYSDIEARAIWTELKNRGLLRSGAKANQSVSTIQPGNGQQEQAQKEDPKPRPPIDPADLAKAFALWQGGASSVRKLEAAAKAANYNWSNGKIRALIEEMERRKLIQVVKREPSAV